MQFDKNIYRGKSKQSASIIQTIVSTIVAVFILLIICAVLAFCEWGNVEYKRIALERVSGKEVTWWDAYWLSGK